MTDMHNKDKRLVDRGWEAMSTTLGIEMPIKKGKKRLLIWWLFGLGLLAIISTLYIANNTSIWNVGGVSNNQSDDIANTEKFETGDNESMTSLNSPTKDIDGQSLSSAESPQQTFTTHENADRIITGENKIVKSNQIKSSNDIKLENTNAISNNISSEHVMETHSNESETLDRENVKSSDLNNNDNNNYNTSHVQPFIDEIKYDTAPQVISSAKTPSNNSADNSDIISQTISRRDQLQPSQLALRDKEFALDQVPIAGALSNESAFIKPSVKKSIYVENIALLPTLYLNPPEAYPVQMSIQPALSAEPISKSFKTYTSLLLGANSSYLYPNKSWGYGIIGGISFHTSMRWSINPTLEYGRYRINTLRKSASALRLDVTQSNEDNSQKGPSDPTISSDNSNELEEAGEAPNRDPLNTEAINELQSLSLANLSYVRPSVEASYAFSNKFSGVISVGADYVFQGQFDDNALTQLGFFPALKFQNQWIPSFHTGISYHVTNSFNFSLTHRYYSRELYSSTRSPLKLNQLRIGIRYAIPLRRIE